MLQKTNMIARENGSLDQGIIAVVDRGVDHGYHARPGEDSLCDDRTGKGSGDLKSRTVISGGSAFFNPWIRMTFIFRMPRALRHRM